MSSADDLQASHITESLIQLLGTAPKERTMEYSVYCDIPNSLFELNNGALAGLIESRIKDALSRCENRVSLTNLEVLQEGNTVNVNIRYIFIPYNQEYTALVKVGEK